MGAILRSRLKWRSESGAELVEFALAFPLLLLVVMGIIDFGFLFQRYEVLTNAAREGARVAVLPTYQGAGLDDNVRARVLGYLDAAGLDETDATVLPVEIANESIAPGTCMTTYKVTVTFPHEYSFVGGIMGYFGGTMSSTTLRAVSKMRGESSC
jgi:Flp pilus assembly protein TadG